MRHRPHLFVERPWSDDNLALPIESQRHLKRVLRYADGGQVTYTDGAGTHGEGTWTGSSIQRGPEIEAPRPLPDVQLAVAPPKSKDRQRFIVEKAQELGVQSLVWLLTDHGQAQPPSPERAAAWARNGLEQSRGAWLMDVAADPVGDLSAAVVLDADAPRSLAEMHLESSVTLAVGPEGGFSTAELDSAQTIASIPTNTLRTDTAAIVATAIVRALHR